MINLDGAKCGTEEILKKRRGKIKKRNEKWRIERGRERKREREREKIGSERERERDRER